MIILMKGKQGHAAGKVCMVQDDLWDIIGLLISLSFPMMLDSKLGTPKQFALNTYADPKIWQNT